MAEIWELDAVEVADAIRSGSLAAVDALDAHLDRIERLDGDLHAFVQVDAEGARARATEIDAALARGEDPGPWAGVPIAVKETQACAGLLHEEGSLLYEGRIAERDDRPIAKLRAAGAVFVGTTTAPEFGSLNWTRTKLHGITGSPWDPSRTPGGSSGGSSAAVSAGMVPIATGGDGGGSIRIPSAYAGLFGVKVTSGRIAAVPFDTSLTTVHGPMARSVRDAARYVDVCAGPDPADPTSLPALSVSYEHAVTSGEAAEALRGRRVAWSSTIGGAICDPDVERVAHDAAMALIESAGLELVEAELPTLPRMGGAWAVLSSLDMIREHGADAEGRHDELTPAVRGGFELVTDAGIDAVARALNRREQLLERVGELFADVDLLMTPTTATTAFAAKGPPPREIAGQRVGAMGSVPYTAPFNITGQPAVSIPAGLVDGLPVGLQVVARRHEEPLVLGAGALAEQHRPWPKLAP